MMPAYLIEYHRLSGDVRISEYSSLVAATQARLELDGMNHNPQVEIVAVASESQEYLRQSHSRYFSASSS